MPYLHGQLLRRRGEKYLAVAEQLAIGAFAVFDGKRQLRQLKARQIAGEEAYAAVAEAEAVRFGQGVAGNEVQLPISGGGALHAAVVNAVCEQLIAIKARQLIYGKRPVSLELHAAKAQTVKAVAKQGRSFVFASRAAALLRRLIHITGLIERVEPAVVDRQLCKAARAPVLPFVTHRLGGGVLAQHERFVFLHQQQMPVVVHAAGNARGQRFSK